jgi:oligopeptide/dipeptide ABC transporter ATP-binding protein
MAEERQLLRVETLEKIFPIRGGILSKRKSSVHAVSKVSFEISKGETLGLVGESGCGKTTVALCLPRIIEPTGGRIFFGGEDILSFDKLRLRTLRRRMQIIFQDPYGSLDPQMTVGRIVGEGLAVHGVARGSEREDRIDEMLHKVGLSPEYKSRAPNEFSGGQRQRIGIARALILEPELVIGDEPVSALDVSTQAQVLNLLVALQKEFRFSYLMISHDLSVVKYVSDRVVVMYLGKIVEIARSHDIYNCALHPYTLALLSAIPVPDPGIKKVRILLTGDIPSPINPPSGCRFHTRCPRRIDICSMEEPQFKEVSSQHYVACHLV